MLPIRRLLVRHLVSIQLPTLIILVGLVGWGCRSLMLSLAQREGETRLRIAAQAMDERLHRVELAGRLVERYWKQGRLSFEATGEIGTLLMPWLSSQSEIQLLNLLDEQGRSILLANNPTGWKAREIRLNRQGGRELRWRDIDENGLSAVMPPFGNSATYDARRRGWYQEARRVESPRWSTPYRLDPPELKLVLTWLVPLKHPDGRLAGALGLDLPAQELQELLEVLRPTPGSQLWVLDQAGDVLSEAHGEKGLPPPPGKPRLPGASSHRFLRADLPAHAGARWQMLLAIPERDLLAAVQGRLIALTAAASLLFALPILWGFRLGRRLSRSVRGLAEAAEQLGPDRPPELSPQEVTEFQTLGRALERAHEEYQHHLRLQQQLQQSQRIETLGTLAGGIAHDVNNHLGAILGHIFLAREGLPEGHPSCLRLKEAEDAAERCARTTRTLLTFSRQGTPELVPLDLNELVRTCAELLGRVLGDQIRISLDLDPTHPRIAGDQMQVELAITNLAVNARDAMPAGGLLRLQTRAQEDGAVLLKLSDTGEGILPEHLPRIFDPFFTTKPVGKGTGLGLSMVFGILEAHGGSIEVDSQPGRGTCFTLRFPSVLANRVHPSPTEPAKDTRGPLAGRRILIAEDEGYLRETLEEALGVAGAEVVGAADGEEAWQLFQQRPFDGVLSDQRMPECTGADLLKRIRATGSRVPFILASGQDLAAFKPLAAMDDRLALLSKPFSIASLLEHMKRLNFG